MNIMDLFKWEAPQEGEFKAHPNWPTWAVWSWWNVVRNPWISSWIPAVKGPLHISGTYVKGNFNPAGGWNFLMINGNDMKVSRPFVSFRGLKLAKFRGIEFYFGWKPNQSGDSHFGIALRVANASAITGPHINSL